MESYFEAKRRLFLVEPRPIAVVNVGDEYGRRLAEELPDALTFSAADASALGGIALKLRGRFNVENALGALTAARALGIEEDAIRRGLESVRGVPGRFESVDVGHPFHVIVDYAHKPDALEKLLRAVRELAPKSELVLLFGCGGDRDKGKRPQMGEIASRLADRVIVTSDNPRGEQPQAIIDEIVRGIGGKNYETIADRRAAIQTAIDRASNDQVIVIAGKGHEAYQVVGDRILHFDDKEEAELALKKRAHKAVPNSV
jgi:UDP-N-acetylmuramoyl-L-alanyl-D-glutamate--2,6-diaminopimelate ligase